MTINEERKEFEKWARQTWPKAAFARWLEREADGTFVIPSVESMFMAWQESARRTRAESS